MKVLLFLATMMLSTVSLAIDGWPRTGTAVHNEITYSFMLDDIQQQGLYLFTCNRDPKDHLASIATYKHYSSTLKSIFVNGEQFKFIAADAHFDGQFCDQRLAANYTLYFKRDHQGVALSFTHNPYYPGRFSNIELQVSGSAFMGTIDQTW